jgi:nitroreductase
MEFQEVIRKRRMVRAFTGEPIAPEVVDRLLRAANRAPSAGFSQGYAMLVLESAEDRAAFWRAASGEEGAASQEAGSSGEEGEASQEAGSSGEPSVESSDADGSGWAADPTTAAPLIVIPCSNKEIYLDRYARPDKGWSDRDEARWPVPFWHIDTGMLTMLLLLAAVDEGLGALYFGIAPEAVGAVRERFGIPADFAPIGAVAIGHPDPDTDAKQVSSAHTIKRRGVEDIAHRGHWALPD